MSPDDRIKHDGTWIGGQVYVPEYTVNNIGLCAPHMEELVESDRAAG